LKFSSIPANVHATSLLVTACAFTLLLLLPQSGRNVATRRSSSADNIHIFQSLRHPCQLPCSYAAAYCLCIHAAAAAAEWEEWGNPQQQQFYECMKSYSPVDNVKAQE
jgi:hypothetical protein